MPLIEDLQAGGQDLIVVKQDPRAAVSGGGAAVAGELVWVAAPGMVAEFGALMAAAGAGGGPCRWSLSPAPCVYRSRAMAALDAAHMDMDGGVHSSPSHAGCSAAVTAGLGYAVMPRAMVAPGLQVLGPDRGWPALAEAEIALLGAPRLSPAAAALADFIEDRVVRRRGD